MNKTYLVHHGIKGQRWGVRRYQNEDGTLTALGKRKYGEVKETAEGIKTLAEKRSKYLKNKALKVKDIAVKKIKKENVKSQRRMKVLRFIQSKSVNGSILTPSPMKSINRAKSFIEKKIGILQKTKTQDLDKD